MISSQTDLLVQHSRRQLWIALMLVLALGTATLLMLAFPGKGSDSGKSLMLLYPEMLAVALLSLRRSKKQLGEMSASRKQAVVDDELRQHSLNLGWRNGFLAVLLGQPVFAFLVSGSGSPHPVALLAGASALTGVVTVLASVLWYDR